MTVSATLDGVFLKGTAAARPAANAVAGGSVYSATDTGVISQSDGASWSTWATIAAGMTNPMTTAGDIIYGGASGTPTRLAAGTSTQALMGGTTPAWGPGAATSWTPALTASTTNPTLGSGSSVSGGYIRLGKLVICWGNINWGTSGVNAGSGEYRLSLPVASSGASPRLFGPMLLYDSSAGSFRSGAGYDYDGTAVRIGHTSPGALASDSSPWTWAASDQIVWQFAYEAA